MVAALAYLEEEHPGEAAAAAWARGVLLGAGHALEERVYRGWLGLGYHHDAAGYVCGIFPRPERLALSLESGARLPDPAGLLTGAGRTVRSVIVADREEPGAEAIADVVEAAIALQAALRPRRARRAAPPLRGGAARPQRG